MKNQERDVVARLEAVGILPPPRPEKCSMPEGQDYTLHYFLRGDFTGLDLSKRDFTLSSFRHCLLMRADLRGATLAYASLLFSDLAQADLREAIATQSVFRGCRLNGAKLSLAGLDKVTIETCAFGLANMDYVVMREAHVELTALDEASVSGADFTRTRWVHCRLKGLDCGDADLSSATFTECVLEDISFRGAHLRNTKFVRCVLRECEFGPFLMEGAQMKGCVADAYSAKSFVDGGGMCDTLP